KETWMRTRVRGLHAVLTNGTNIQRKVFTCCSTWSVGMIRYLAIVVLLLSALPTGAPAQEGHRGTPQQQRACRGDVLRLCRAVKDQDDFTIANCLKAHDSQLSSACRRVLRESGA